MSRARLSSSEPRAQGTTAPLRTAQGMDVLEVKRALEGGVRTFPCRAVEMTGDRAILLYTLPHPAQVADLALPAGTLTIAHFWVGRPYNVYHWISPEGETLAYYFNLSGLVTLTHDTVEWEDLEVDILVTPDGRARVLDEDRIPESAAARRGEIARGRALVLREFPQVVREVEAASRALLARDGRLGPSRPRTP